MYGSHTTISDDGNVISLTGDCWLNHQGDLIMSAAKFTGEKPIEFEVESDDTARFMFGITRKLADRRDISDNEGSFLVTLSEGDYILNGKGGNG